MNAWLTEARAILVDPSRLLDTSVRYLDDAIEPRVALPWILTATSAVPVALLVGVPSGGVGIGLLIGTLVAGAVAWHSRRQALKHAEDLARVIADIHADADRRVELVTRQYEWAVNDVANLRDALRRSQTRSAGERWAQELKRESRPVRRVAVPLTSSIYAEGSLTSVRFEAGETIPAQIRIVDERGAVVAISARVMEPGNSSFVLRISQGTADSLLHPDDSSLRIEALVDEHWHVADLRGPGESSEARDEVETHAQTAQSVLSTDKRGRVWSSAS
jgi:hypothetical protein